MTSIANASSSNQSHGDIIMVGGALETTNEGVWARIIEAGGGAQSRFGVLTAASIPKSQDPYAGDPSKCDNSECNGAYYSDILIKKGAGHAEWIPVDLDHPNAANNPALAMRAHGYTGFFIGGGDQSRLVDLLVKSNYSDSKLLSAILYSIQNGAGVAGTSAGTTIQQAGPMVTSGESYQGVRDGALPHRSKNPNTLTYRAAGGFGLFTGGLIDTHFGVRGREGRLIRLLADTHNTLGFGIDENTALIAAGGTDMLSVLGERNVHLYNLTDSTTADDSHWGIRTVRWSLLADGDTMDLATGQFVHAPGAAAYKGEDKHVSLTSTDVFSSYANKKWKPHVYEMVRLAWDLVSSRLSEHTSGLTFERKPEYQVTLSIGERHTAWKKPGQEGASFQDVVIDMTAT